MPNTHLSGSVLRLQRCTIFQKSLVLRRVQVTSQENSLACLLLVTRLCHAFVVIFQATDDTCQIHYPPHQTRRTAKCNADQQCNHSVQDYFGGLQDEQGPSYWAALVDRCFHPILPPDTKNFSPRRHVDPLNIKAPPTLSKACHFHQH